MTHTIGQSVPRTDARAKVTGEAKYPADYTMPDTLHAKILFSGRPHARILEIDTTEAEAVPGVVAIFTARDVPVNKYGLQTTDQPVLCGPGSGVPGADVVRFIADQVAVVVAETERAAARARDLIHVTYEDLPTVTDPFEALKPGAPQLHPYRQPNPIHPELSTEGIGAMQQSAAEGLDWEWNETHYPKGPVQRSAQGLPDVRSAYAGVVERGTMEAAWEWLKFTCAEEWFQEQGITRVSARLPGLMSVVRRWPTIIREMKPGLENVDIETIIDAIDMGYLSGSPNFRFHREAQELLDPAFEAILVTGEQPPEYIKEVAAQVTAQQKELYAETYG